MKRTFMVVLIEEPGQLIELPGKPAKSQTSLAQALLEVKISLNDGTIQVSEESIKRLREVIIDTEVSPPQSGGEGGDGG